MGKNKKAKIEEPVESDYTDSEDSDDSMIDESITATFEGRNLEDFDFHGIKQLLLQSFLKAPIDVSQITDILINQQGIGSVLKQAPENEDEEDEDDDMNIVYGVTTVLNLSARRETPAVLQLIDYLKQKAKEHADKETLNKFNNILCRNENLGFLINERFLNIPAAISAPMLSSLQDEINRMKKRHPEYNFKHFIMLCKTYKYKSIKQDEPSFANDEEMLFSVNTDCSFEFNVTKDCDVAVGGKWGSKEDEIAPFRKVLIVSADKIPNILNQINTFVQA